MPDISVCIKDKPSTWARRFVFNTNRSIGKIYIYIYLISASISTPCRWDQCTFLITLRIVRFHLLCNNLSHVISCIQTGSVEVLVFP